MANLISLSSKYIRDPEPWVACWRSRGYLALGLLRPWWPGVGFCYLASPRNQVGRGIVSINDAFDQRGPVTVRDCHFDSFLQFLPVGGTQAAPTTILGIKRPDQPGIVPIFDVVVGAVMDLDLDRIPVIVDKKDDHRQLPPDHLRHLLCGELK